MTEKKSCRLAPRGIGIPDDGHRFRCRWYNLDLGSTHTHTQEKRLDGMQRLKLYNQSKQTHMNEWWSLWTWGYNFLIVCWLGFFEICWYLKCLSWCCGVQSWIGWPPTLNCPKPYPYIIIDSCLLFIHHILVNLFSLLFFYSIYEGFWLKLIHSNLCNGRFFQFNLF